MPDPSRRRWDGPGRCPASRPDPLLPTLLEDVEVGPRVIGGSERTLDIQGEAQARPRRQRKVSVGWIDRWMPGDEVAGPRLVEGIEMLLDEEVGEARRELQADRGRHRPTALVGRDVAAVGARQICDGERVRN